jgi:hypothetical protein
MVTAFVFFNSSIFVQLEKNSSFNVLEVGTTATTNECQKKTDFNTSLSGISVISVASTQQIDNFDERLNEFENNEINEKTFVNENDAIDKTGN